MGLYITIFVWIVFTIDRVDEMSKKIEEEKILEKQNMETLKGRQV